MSQLIRREAVFAITGIVTVLMFVEYFFFPQDWIVASTIRNWAVIIYNLSLGLGAVRLIMQHVMGTQRRRENWQFSLLFLVAFVIMLFTGLAGYLGTGVATSNSIYNWLFNHVYTSLGATTYAITGFYIFSAAYRAFRARNVDASLMLIAGCFVILSNAPVGEVIWSGIPVIGEWFRFVGQVPGMRVFGIVGALGTIAYGFRALLGKEKGFYAGGAEE